MLLLCQVMGGATHYMCLVPPTFRAKGAGVEQSRGKGFWAAQLFCWYRPATHLVASGRGGSMPCWLKQCSCGTDQPVVCKWYLWFWGHMFWHLRSPHWLLLRCC